MPLQSRALFSERVLHIEPIYELIFDCCSAATLLRVARTCRTARYAIAAYIRVAYDINRLLARFFPSPEPPCASICAAPSPHVHTELYDRARAFRGLQARTGTLISGSCALQFFDRVVYPESDLDLYVHMRHRREVGRWLLQEGYQFAPTPFQDARFEVEVVHGMSPSATGIYRMPGVAAVLTFTRPAPQPPRALPEMLEELEIQDEPREERLLKVQVIVAKNTPMEAVLAFHSTCVMNVISYEKAYCLFPRATLEKRFSLLSYSCRGRSKRRESGLAKYARRGFTLVTELTPDGIELDPASSASPSPTASGTSSPYPAAPATTRYRARANDNLSHTQFLYGFATGRTPPAPAPSSSPAPPPQPKPKAPFRLGWRWIDDSASWVLPLPLAGVARAPAANASTRALAHDPVAVCNWEVRYAPGAGGAVMHFAVATGKVLRYRYLVTDEPLLAFLGRELSARMRAEEVKANEELEDWTYYDEDLPSLCREFLHGSAERRLAALRERPALRL